MPDLEEILEDLASKVHKVEFDQSQRDVVLIALAKLSLSRPGWYHSCIKPIAEKLGGLQEFEEFRSHGPDGPVR